MALMISDMDNFTLAELDDFTLHELDNMSYNELVLAVQTKCKVADRECDKDILLSEAQVQAITSIIHSYAKEHDQSLVEAITVGVAINAIWELIKFCTTTAIEHASEIAEVMRQAYLLLEQLIQQIPK